MSNTPRTLETAAIAILISSLIFTAGWSYAYHWYDRFDLGLIGLGIPFQYHFMYGFWVIQSFWWLALIIALLLAAVLALFWRWIGPWLVPTAPLWIPLAFVLVYLLGGAAAGGDHRDHRATSFERYPWVRVWVAPEQGGTPTRFQAVQGELAAGKYRLLLQTANSLYLMKPKGGGEIPILQLPLSQVQALRRIPTNPGGR